MIQLDTNNTYLFSKIKQDRKNSYGLQTVQLIQATQLHTNKYKGLQGNLPAIFHDIVPK